MKKISFYKVAICAVMAGSLLLSSCVDDLNTTPGGKNLTSEDAWRKDVTYKSLLAKVYAGLTISGNNGASGAGDLTNGDQGVATFTRSLWSLQEAPTDEVLCVWDDAGLKPLQFAQWSPQNNYVYQFYQRAMLNVGFANEYLKQTTDAKLSDRGMMHMKPQVDVYREEIKALKALNYFYLMDLYGNPAFAEETAGMTLPKQILRKDLFDWIEKELTTIEQNGILPAKSYSGMSLATVRTVLAKMYLNAEIYREEKMYDKAAIYAKKVISMYGELHPKYSDLFRADNDTRTNEIIFGLPYDSQRAPSYGGTTYLMAATFYEEMKPTLNFGLNGNWVGNRAPQELTRAFDKDKDSRFLFFTKGKDRVQDITDWTDFNQGYPVTKYSNLRSDQEVHPNPANAPAFADTDYPLFRLADVFLIYAEALVRDGSTSDEITTYFNKVRTRAGLSALPLGGITLDEILDERLRELYWEGQRRTDLIRFNKYISNYNWVFKGGSASGMDFDAKVLLYPIPSLELGANPNLKQNPGYPVK